MLNIQSRTRLFFMMGFLMLVTTTLSAQGRHNNRYSQRGNGYYSRPHSGYRHSYRPAYRPSYRPYYRPSYRPIYRTRPIYRAAPYRRPYVHFGPRFGIRINVLPFGYNRVVVGSVPYYYNQGVYYRPYTGGGYQVTAPPLGAIVNNLPPGAAVTVIDGQKYYEVGGTFYQEIDGGGYAVVGTDGVLNTADAGDQPYADDPQPDDNGQ